MENVVEIVGIAKSYPFTRSEVSSIVIDIAKKYLKEKKKKLMKMNF